MTSEVTASAATTAVVMSGIRCLTSDFWLLISDFHFFLFPSLKLARLPACSRLPRRFTFYVARPTRFIETRSPPGLPHYLVALHSMSRVPHASFFLLSHGNEI